MVECFLSKHEALGSIPTNTPSTHTNMNGDKEQKPTMYSSLAGFPVQRELKQEVSVKFKLNENFRLCDIDPGLDILITKIKLF